METKRPNRKKKYKLSVHLNEKQRELLQVWLADHDRTGQSVLEDYINLLIGYKE